MLILDTDDLPRRDRVDAYNAAAVGTSGACSIEHELDEGVRFRKRMEIWHFGPVVLFANSGSGMRYWQTEQHLRLDGRDSISLFSQVHGTGGFVCNDRQRSLTSADLAFTCKSAGYWETRWSGAGESIAFMLDAERLGLPGSMIRDATPLAEHSEIAPMLLTQLKAMRGDAERLSGDAGVEALGDAVVSLVRALVASVSAPRPTRLSVAEETRYTRILAHLRAHLADPGLTAARVAAVHNLSVAALHRIFHDHGADLDQWIAHHRLEGARADLASPAHAHRPATDIARSWGFADPARFTRLFRRTYGASPAQWRHRHLTP
ncbi:AraC-like DNA-binding protein [Actinocorallia herbida]|uniref:AraC-like DNA-binding protein n=1 Tax=Actinocorallia herbida TaxID=58109 RepID=A0A3N1CYA8_9ACTN|nr:helix-turn-helix domain-containing protein [Actinocorallia herbida]ROO86273.1 AraC-like DNA-binding protein [Actinocorallia herbida]